MTVYHNDSYNFIDDQEYFCQYCRWILHEHDRNKTQTSPTQVRSSQLCGVSNSHVFIGITMFAYIRPVKCNVQIINGSKALAKGFGLVIIKIPKTNIIIPFWPPYYMPQNPQNIISQTTIKHYNQFRSVITEALRTCYRSTCPFFLCALSFEGTIKRAHTYLSQCFKGFYFWIAYYTIYSWYCVLGYFSGNNHSCGEKHVPVSYLWFWGAFPKSPFSIFTYQRSSQIFGGYLCRPLSGVGGIKSITNIHKIHQNMLPLTLIWCKIMYSLIYIFVCIIT